jgi:riboflavin kinase/FMN adenylyltransferase
VLAGRARAVTIGVFDGVHRGHRRLIEALRAEAASRGLETAAITFHPHPSEVLYQGSPPRQLCDLGHKLQLLMTTGLDEVRVLGFDARRARMEPEQFVSEVLVAGLSSALVVVGEGFRFGRARRGDVEMLTALGQRAGFTVIGAPLVTDGEAGEVISSSRIRRLLAEGDIAEAARLLERPVEIRCRVSEVSPGVLEPLPRLQLPRPGAYRARILPLGSPGGASPARLVEIGEACVVIDPEDEPVDEELASALGWPDWQLSGRARPDRLVRVVLATA